MIITAAAIAKTINVITITKVKRKSFIKKKKK